MSDKLNLRQNYPKTDWLHLRLAQLSISFLSCIYTARSAGQKGCVNRQQLRSIFIVINEPIRAKQVNQSSTVIGWQNREYTCTVHICVHSPGDWNKVQMYRSKTVPIKVCALMITKSKMYADPFGGKTGFGLCGVRKGICNF